LPGIPRFRGIYSGSVIRYPLFFVLPHPRLKVFCEVAITLADNFLQKQQKQRDHRFHEDVTPVLLPILNIAGPATR
jgi:hypothetical protein